MRPNNPIFHLRSAMRRHKTIILEEPPTPGFKEMLRGEISIPDYLLETDMEYPVFSHKSCVLWCTLWREGRGLLQIEPYLGELMEIHEGFAQGATPGDLDPSTSRYRVYEAEHRATETLLNYYRSALRDPFENVVNAVKAFARAASESLHPGLDPNPGLFRFELLFHKSAFPEDEAADRCQQFRVQFGPPEFFSSVFDQLTPLQPPHISAIRHTDPGPIPIRIPFNIGLVSGNQPDNLTKQHDLGIMLPQVPGD